VIAALADKHWHNAGMPHNTTTQANGLS
jgi:hypothetical protein